MRDIRKPAAYFESFLQAERGRIKKTMDKLCGCSDEAKTKRLNARLLLYRMNVLIASFSYGADKTELLELLDDACSAAQGAGGLTYSNALTIASFAIMLDSGSAAQDVISQNQMLFDNDKLLHCLDAYLKTGKAEWSGRYQFPAQYGGLDAVFAASTEESRLAALRNYLETWYAKCTDSAWYDTLDNPHDVYFGYWCFESAALAKVLELDTHILAQNEYFPKI